MKTCGQEKKVTLPIHGREMTLSETELIAILEKHFSNEATEQATTAKVARVPTEDHWFEVDPQTINESLFQETRKDERQEKTRKLILDALAAAKRSPEKYLRSFKTMMPKKTWTFKKIEDLKREACKKGDYIADWVEQALEWAQRISNGESWEALCNDPDTANWYRLILSKNGYVSFVGGGPRDFCCCHRSYIDPPSHINDFCYGYHDKIYHTVPLVVLYEK